MQGKKYWIQRVGRAEWEKNIRADSRPCSEGEEGNWGGEKGERRNSRWNFNLRWGDLQQVGRAVRIIKT